MNLPSDMVGDLRGPYAIGALLLGKYRVEQVIGQGGMGLVLGAIHVELQHRVAIKVLLPGGPGGEVFEARFLREAQAAASLRSENVVRVYDVGRLEDHSPYMVMEWLDGRDLSSGPIGAALPPEEAVDYLIQACDAMAAAHNLKMVHRDLKPANLFLVHDEYGVPTIKVLDFGISKLRQNGEQNFALTEANGVMGSPLYMSPEQMRSARDVDARADIWSLGTILYELLAGVPPFNGDTLGAVFHAVAQGSPHALTELRPELSPQLEAVVLKCLEKDADKRFSCAQDLQRALLPFSSMRSQAKMAMRSSAAPPMRASSSAPAPPIAQAMPVARTTGGWSESAPKARGIRRRFRTLVVGSTALVLVVAGTAFWAMLAHRGDPNSQERSHSNGTAMAVPLPGQEPPQPSVTRDPLEPPSNVASGTPRPDNAPNKPTGASATQVSRLRQGSQVEAAPTATASQKPSSIGQVPVAPRPAPAPSPRRNPLDIQFK